MFIHQTLRLLAFLCFFPAAGSAQTIADKADALLKAYHQQDLFTGTVLIAKEGRIVFERSYGMANRESNLPNRSTTQYRIGSLSKPFTSLIIHRLMEKGWLHINDPLNKYLPGFSRNDSVTIEHLLNHTSGIRSITSMEQYRTGRSEIKGMKEVIAILKSQPPVFSPGSSWQYSNSNYLLLSYVAEKITGKTMAQLVGDFADKLHMQNTGMDYDGRKAPTRALGYEAGLLDDYVPVADNNITLLTGAGGMYSTASDLFLLDRALYTDKLLSKVARDKMYVPGKGNYGYGWEIGNYKGRMEISHSGSIEGFKSMMLRYPESGTCIIFLSNYWNTPGPEICESLKAIAFGEGFKMPETPSLIVLSAEQLKSYEGEYSFNGAMVMTIKAESGMLLSIIKGQPVVGFKPLSEKEFYNKSNDARMQFTHTGNESFDAFKLIKGKQVMEWKRIKPVQ